MTTSERSPPSDSEQTDFWNEGSTSSRAAFRVQTFRSRDGALASTAKSRVSGATLRDVLARFDPLTRSWRTSQLSFLETEGDGLAEFSETWPRSGISSNGIVSRLPDLARRTDAIESGFWPTPSAQESLPTEELVEEITDSQRATHERLYLPGRKHHSQRTLARAVRTWPTPKSSPSGPDYARTNRPESGGDDLATAVARWPTPMASDSQGSGSRNTPGSKAHPGVSLTDAVRGDGGIGRTPTPSANDWKGSSKSGQRRGQLTDPAMGVIPPGGQLNPTWVEWLMGFPLGWTDSNVSGTRSSLRPPS